MSMRLIENHSGGNSASRNLRWFGRRGIAIITGTLGAGSSVTIYFRLTERETPIEIMDLPVGITEFNAGNGYIFVEFERGTEDSTNLNVDIQERPVGY